MDDQLGLVNVVLQQMQKTLECTICLDLLINPHTTKCGHSFCNECLERLFMESKGSTKCPLCNASVTKRSLTQNPKIVSFVTAVKKIILSIKGDFGFAESPKKLKKNVIEASNEQSLECSKRVQRKRDQTTLFDAQLFVAKIAPIKGIKLGLPPEVGQGNSSNIENGIFNINKRINIASGHKKDNAFVEVGDKIQKIAKDIDHKNEKQNCEIGQKLINGEGEIVQKKGKRVTKSKKMTEEPIANSTDKNDQNKSFEKVTDWLTMNCQVDFPAKAVPTSEVSISTDHPVSDVFSQSTVVFKYSPNKRPPISGTDGKAVDESPQLGSLDSNPAETTNSMFSNSKITRPNSTAVAETESNKGNNAGRKRQLDDDFGAATRTTKIRKNIRFASEVKTQLLDNSKSSVVQVKRRTKKSPGWATIDGTKRELRSRGRSLNITGGNEKPGNATRTEIPLTDGIPTPDSLMVIEEDTQVAPTKMEPVRHHNYTVRRKVSKRQRSSYLLHAAEKTNNNDRETVTEGVLAKGLQSTGCFAPKSSSLNQGKYSAVETFTKPTSPLERFAAETKSIQSDQQPFPSNQKRGNIEHVNGLLGNAADHSILPNLIIPRNQSLNSSSATGSSPVNDLNQKSIGNSRNVTNLERLQQPTSSCYHSIPCHLFRALKMFVLSQNCHSDEKRGSETDSITNLFERDDHCATNSPAQRDSIVVDNDIPQISPASSYNREPLLPIDVPSTDSSPISFVNSNVDGGASGSVTANSGNNAVRKVIEVDPVEIMVQQTFPDNNLLSGDNEADVELVRGMNPSLSPPTFSSDSGTLKSHDDLSGSILQVKSKLLSGAQKKDKIVKKKVSKIPVVEITGAETALRTRRNREATSSANQSTSAKCSSIFAKSSHANVEIPNTKSIIGKRKFAGNASDKKYKRIRTQKDSSDSSEEDTALLVATSKPESVEVKYHLDSEEWRDFQRLDENVVKCFQQAELDERKASKPEQSKADNFTVDHHSVSDESPPKSYADKTRPIDTYSSSSEDEIPCTDEVSATKFMSDVGHATQWSEIEPQYSMVSTVTEVPLSQSTENLINKCNQSLHRAEQLLVEEDKQDAVNCEDNRNMSFASVMSTQSVYISTQKKTMVEGEVLKLREEITALEELKRKKAAVSKAPIQKKPVTKPPRRKAVTRNVPTSDSVELFSTAPSSSGVANGPSSPVSEPPPMPRENKENAHPLPRIAISKRNYRNKKILIVCTGLSPSEVNLTRQFAATICDKNSQVVSNWNTTVSHVIVHTDEEGVSERTLKYLYGVATGAWVVSYEWVKDSLKTGKLLREDTYEALDCTGVPGPLRGRTLLHHVFEGCQLCLLPPFDNLTMLQVEDLVSICGAEIVKNTAAIKEKPGMKIVIVGSSQSNETLNDNKASGYICVTCDWLIECIGMASRISLIPYLVGEPDTARLSKSCVPTSLLCETQNYW